MKYIFTFLLSAGISLVLSVIVYNTIPKTGYVDNRKLFEAFEGKKELQSQLEHGANKRKAQLDSLGLTIQSLEQLAQSDEAAYKKMLYLQQQYELLNRDHQNKYQDQSSEFTEAIWKQISSYTFEYGEKSGYDYILGVAGQGSLMYGKVEYDITNEVISYINSKYAGN